MATKDTKKTPAKTPAKAPAKAAKKPNLKIRELTEDELVKVAGGMLPQVEPDKSRQSVCRTC